MLLQTFASLIYNCAYSLKETNPDADGREWWQGIKSIINNYAKTKDPSVEWKKPISRNGILCYDNIPIDETRNLTEYTIDGFGTKHCIEVNHFLIQQVRIPYDNQKITLVKLIQIALNKGQLEGIRKNNSEFNILNYIEESDVNKFYPEENLLPIYEEVLAFLSNE